MIYKVGHYYKREFCEGWYTNVIGGIPVKRGDGHYIIFEVRHISNKGLLATILASTTDYYWEKKRTFLFRQGWEDVDVELEEWEVVLEVMCNYNP